MTLASKHSVEDDEKFTHASGERLLCRFASRAQALVSPQNPYHIRRWRDLLSPGLPAAVP
jgi:hypothetical protein